MARLYEENIVIILTRAVKGDAKDPAPLVNTELVEALEDVMSKLVEGTAIVEVKTYDE